MSGINGYVLDELRLARTMRDLSQDEFGKRIGYSGSHVSSVETGGRPPTREYVAALDRTFETGERYTRMLSKLSKIALSPSWLRQWIEYEREAVVLRWFEPAYVPGLLQTEAYARATLAGGRFSAEEIDSHVASRLERQAILSRERPPQLVAVLDEAVLRRPVHDRPGLMLEQVEHLAALASSEHIQLQLVPISTGMYLGLAGQFIIADLPDDGRVAYADNQLDAQIVDRPGDVARLARTWEVIRNEALPRRQSLQLIKEVAKSWT